MKFIQKDVNKRLLILIMVLLIAVISLTIFNELKSRKILNEYTKNNELYGEVTSNSVLEQLNKTSALKETALRDKKYLERKYNELADINEKLKEEVESLKSELILIRSSEEYQKVRDGGPAAQFRLIQNKNSEIIKLKEKISNICSKLKSYNISEQAC